MTTAKKNFKKECAIKAVKTVKASKRVDTPVYEAPHVKTTSDKVSPYVLVCGDPARTIEIAELCDSYEEVAYNREYNINAEGSFNINYNF